MDQNEDKSVIKWSRWSVFQNSRVQKLDSICDNVPSLPLTLSCYILSCLLDAAIENYQAVKGSSILGSVQVEAFFAHLLWDLCKLTIQMLSQSLDHRSCASSLLLPSIFKAFACRCSIEVCIQGETYYMSRCSIIAVIQNLITSFFFLLKVCCMRLSFLFFQATILLEIVEQFPSSICFGTCREERCIWYNLSVSVFLFFC